MFLFPILCLSRIQSLTWCIFIWWPGCFIHDLLVKMCTNCQAPCTSHWASVWQTELTPGCVNPGFKLEGLVLAVVDSQFPCYFFDFELKSRPSEYQIKSSEDFVDQLAALIDNGQEKKKKIGQRISNWIHLKTRAFDWSLSRLCQHSTLNFIRCVWERVGGQGHPNNPEFILPDLRALSQNSAIQLWLRHVTKSHTLQAKLRIHTDAYTRILLFDFH